MITTGGESKCKRCGRWFVPKKDGQQYGPYCQKRVQAAVMQKDRAVQDKIFTDANAKISQQASPRIEAVEVTQHGLLVGFKVYIDGKKYPVKPVKMYTFETADLAINAARMDAGLNPDTVKDVVNAQLPAARR